MPASCDHAGPVLVSVAGVCTVILGWQLWPEAPVFVAANRDELLARPSDPPLLLTDDPPRWGGRDRLAGGTWLAVDPGGRVAAVTNRHPGGRPAARDATRSSRGDLPLQMLQADDTQAWALASELDARRYNPVNVLYASPTAAWSVSLDDVIGRRETLLSPGVHVLTEQDVDDPTDAKTQAIGAAARAAASSAAARAAASSAASAGDLLDAWRQILKGHEAASGGTPACIHGDLHGTVSSASVVVTASDDEDGRYAVGYHHAEGPPCTTPYRQILPISR